MKRDELIIGWVKYIDHNGSKDTELVTCNPDDDGAISICRASTILAREKEQISKVVEPLKNGMALHKESAFQTIQQASGLRACIRQSLSIADSILRGEV